MADSWTPTIPVEKSVLSANELGHVPSVGKFGPPAPPLALFSFACKKRSDFDSPFPALGRGNIRGPSLFGCTSDERERLQVVFFCYLPAWCVNG
jgi:hypothetical protein